METENSNTEIQKTNASSNSNDLLMKVFCYVSILWIVPYLTIKGEKRSEILIHLRQGWIVMLLSILANIFSGMISWIFWVFSLIFCILGIKNVTSNKNEPLPIIGDLLEKIPIK